MRFDVAERVQMALFIVAVPALVFVLVRAWRRDTRDIDTKGAERLKSACPVQIPTENRAIVKKNWLIPVCFAVLIVIFVVGDVIQCVMPFLHRKLEGIDWYESGGYKFVVIFSYIGGYALGILGIVLCVIFEKRRLRTTANVVRIPAYVQSTFKNPKHYTRTAQLIFYDYKKARFRMKTVSVDSYEKRITVLRKKDFVWIAAEERQGSVRFVSLLEEAPEREKTPIELELEQVYEAMTQIEQMMERQRKDGTDGTV